MKETSSNPSISRGLTHFLCGACNATLSISAHLPSTSGPCPFCQQMTTSPVPEWQLTATRAVSNHSVILNDRRGTIALRKPKGGASRRLSKTVRPPRAVPSPEPTPTKVRRTRGLSSKAQCLLIVSSVLLLVIVVSVVSILSHRKATPQAQTWEPSTQVTAPASDPLLH